MSRQSRKLTFSTVLRTRLSRRSGSRGSRRSVGRRICPSLALSARIPSSSKPPERLPLNRQAPARIPNPNVHILLLYTGQLCLHNIVVPFLVDLDCGSAHPTSGAEEWVVESTGGVGITATGDSGWTAVWLVKHLEEGAEVTEETVVERHDGSGGGECLVVGEVIE